VATAEPGGALRRARFALEEPERAAETAASGVEGRGDGHRHGRATRASSGAKSKKSRSSRSRRSSFSLRAALGFLRLPSWRAMRATKRPLLATPLLELTRKPSGWMLVVDAVVSALLGLLIAAVVASVVRLFERGPKGR
jgi:hypothetical protein